MCQDQRGAPSLPTVLSLLHGRWLPFHLQTRPGAGMPVSSMGTLAAGREALGRAEATAGIGGKERHDTHGLGTEEHLHCELVPSGLVLLLAQKTSQNWRVTSCRMALDPTRQGRSSNANCQGPEPPVPQVGSRSKLGASRGSGNMLSSRAGGYESHLERNIPMFPQRI